MFASPGHPRSAGVQRTCRTCTTQSRQWPASPWQNLNELVSWWSDLSIGWSDDLSPGSDDL